MQIRPANELERLVRQTFPEKPAFSAEAELGIGPRRHPIVTFVHGGAARFSTARSGTGSAARPCSRLRISCSTEIMQTEFDEAGGHAEGCADLATVRRPHVSLARRPLVGHARRG